MLFSCTVFDRIGDIWRYKNFVYIKNLTHYTKGSVNKIIIYTFLGIMSHIFVIWTKFSRDIQRYKIVVYIKNRTYYTQESVNHYLIYTSLGIMSHIFDVDNIFISPNISDSITDCTREQHFPNLIKLKQNYQMYLKSDFSFEKCRKNLYL